MPALFCKPVVQLAIETPPGQTVLKRRIQHYSNCNQIGLHFGFIDRIINGYKEKPVADSEDIKLIPHQRW